jgi:hypothetical protein
MITTPTHPEIVLLQRAGNAGALFQSVAQESGGLASISVWGAEWRRGVGSLDFGGVLQLIGQPWFWGQLVP